ncbi:MAG: outer membrane beta-barrel protein [Flavipsychrobacter sp.]
MKKVLLSALALLCGSAYAQDGLYVKPMIGMGSSNLTFRTYNNMPSAVKYYPIKSYTYGLHVGYRLWNWDLSTGIQYLSDGQKYSIVFGAPTVPSLYDSGAITNRYRHLMIPLQVGYHIHVYKGFSIMPQIGAAYSHNMNRKDRMKTQKADSKNTVTDQYFDINYNRSSYFATAKLNIEYDLNELLGLNLSGAYYRMLTNFDNPDGYGNFDPRNRVWAVCGEAGVTVHVNKIRFGKGREKK